MGIVEEFKELEQQTDADLLAMQVGDFYEFFDDDARKVNQHLGLKVSEKSSHGSSYPMAGVPLNEFEPYARELVLGKGMRVAVADQYEENGEHKRRITRVMTPGTMVHAGTDETQYLCAVVVDGEEAGIAFIDVHQGRILMRGGSVEKIPEYLAMYGASEVLVRSTSMGTGAADNAADMIQRESDVTLVQKHDTANIEVLRQRVENQFGEAALEALSIDSSLAVASAGTLLEYLQETNAGITDCINRLQRIGEQSEFMSLDPQTRRNLELTDTRSQGSGGVSLFDTVDHTVTSIGRKQLRQLLQQPLLDQTRIKDRQIDVESLVHGALYRTELQETVENFNSLSRIASQASRGTATPTQVAAIPAALDTVQEVSEVIGRSNELSDTPLAERFDGLNDDAINAVKTEIQDAVGNNPTDTIGEGAIREGYDDELDDVIESFGDHREWFSNLAETVQQRHNLTHVTVDRNQTNGYYIQVGKSEINDVPSHFDEIKQLKNSHRYETDDLRNRERAMLQLEERRATLEEELFDKVLENVTGYSSLLQSVDEAVAYLDAVLSLAQHAVENNWVCPSIEEVGRDISITNGRHPVVEQTEDFVPNDAQLTTTNKFRIVTGPNMAGKSTYLRQTAMIVLLAQIGSFVPADNASIGSVDAIYTRVGALDEISQGRSTFMVEMAELSSILNQATDNSLVILDEVGRGTATEDGVAIAKATIEYLAEARQRTPQPSVLFATHYHELTDLSEELDAVHNVHVAVDTDGDEYKFLRTVEEGAADESYGIRVADAAGVPRPIVDRAREILDDMRANESTDDTLHQVRRELTDIQQRDDVPSDAFNEVMTLLEDAKE